MNMGLERHLNGMFWLWGISANTHSVSGKAFFQIELGSVHCSSTDHLQSSLC